MTAPVAFGGTAFGGTVESVPEADRTATAALYRIARELLHNVERHAETDIVRVSAWCEEGLAYLSVVDDGRGFEPTTARGDGHIGLRIVVQAARAAGGGLEIRSSPDAGSQLTVCVRAESAPLLA